jgi:hypothetical protein
LCASDRFELAREFDDLAGSFLTHALCEVLDSAVPTPSLRDVETRLREAALTRNEIAPHACVPIPFLFGREQSEFVIKKLPGSSAIQIRFSTPTEFDLQGFSGSIRPYLRWESGALLNHAPVDVIYPKEFVERISTLSNYLETDKWPNTIMSEEAKRQVKELVESFLPKLTIEITQSVRTMIAASASSDRSKLSAVGLLVTETYIKAKVFSALRVLISMWLQGEPLPSWREEYVTLDTVWSARLIYGLTWVLQSRLKADFWADGDLLDNSMRTRLFVPQKIGAGQLELDELDEAQCKLVLIPQLLENDEDLGVVSRVSDLLQRSPERIWNDFSFRGETIIETESHNFPDGNWGTKDRTMRIVAETIIEKLRLTAKEERYRAFISLTTGSRVLPALPGKIRELAPDLADDL